MKAQKETEINGPVLWRRASRSRLQLQSDLRRVQWQRRELSKRTSRKAPAVKIPSKRALPRKHWASGISVVTFRDTSAQHAASALHPKLPHRGSGRLPVCGGGDMSGACHRRARSVGRAGWGGMRGSGCKTTVDDIEKRKEGEEREAVCGPSVAWPAFPARTNPQFCTFCCFR